MKSAATVPADAKATRGAVGVGLGFWRGLGLLLGLGAALVAAGGIAGCALFDGDPPSRSCRNDSDCFRAQGERCDAATKTCVTLDAAAAAAGDEAAPADDSVSAEPAGDGVSAWPADDGVSAEASP